MFRRFPTDITALASTPLFCDLSNRELETVSRNGTVVDIAPGRRVRCPRRHPGQFAVVVWGEILATRESGDRCVLRAGDWFGTVSDATSDTVSVGEASVAEPVSFETVRATTLFVMTRQEFVGLRSVCPRVAARVSGLVDESRELYVSHDRLTPSFAR